MTDKRLFILTIAYIILFLLFIFQNIELQKTQEKLQKTTDFFFGNMVFNNYIITENSSKCDDLNKTYNGGLLFCNNFEDKTILIKEWEIKGTYQ